jgi:hypothetical protein
MSPELLGSSVMLSWALLIGKKTVVSAVEEPESHILKHKSIQITLILILINKDLSIKWDTTLSYTHNVYIWLVFHEFHSPNNVMMSLNASAVITGNNFVPIWSVIFLGLSIPFHWWQSWQVNHTQIWELYHANCIIEYSHAKTYLTWIITYHHIGNNSLIWIRGAAYHNWNPYK